MSAAIIPVFAELNDREGRERARRYVAAISGTMLTILSLVSVFGVLTARVWTTLYAAGYHDSGDEFELAVTLTRVVFPCTRMYYAYDDTRTPVYCSALNLVMFAGVSLGLRQRLAHVAIAAGTSAGAIAQLAA